ncbi:MAG: DNA adenine methylase [Spirulinaceae cyanobacterium]
MIKSPLRYPGGKSRAIKKIVEHLPDNFSEYREPFVGGGSLFIYLKQKYPHLKIWINDLNPELYFFWKIAQSDLDKLVKEAFYIKNKHQNGKKLFAELISVDVDNLSEFGRAIRFFVLNRITFSGTVESGGFSQQAFLKRFTHSSIERLEKLASILPGIKITNLDYAHLLQSKDKDVFLFLDPPYFSVTKSKLYGKKGNLHTSFHHERFSQLMKECSASWLITYDDCPEIRDYFKSANLYEWELQYGMNNYKQGSAAKGKELFLANYEVLQNSSEDTVQLSLISFLT